jgi:hypothetical protein
MSDIQNVKVQEFKFDKL